MSTTVEPALQVALEGLSRVPLAERWLVGILEHVGNRAGRRELGYKQERPSGVCSGYGWGREKDRLALEVLDHIHVRVIREQHQGQILAVR